MSTPEPESEAADEAVETTDATEASDATESAIRPAVGHYRSRRSTRSGCSMVPTCNPLPKSPAARKPASRPRCWSVHPARRIGSASRCGDAGSPDPLAVDTGFQLMTLWSLEQTGHSSLPSFVGRYRQFAAHPAGRTIAIHAHVTDVGEHHARADIEFVDSSGAVVAAIGDYECTISLRHAFQRTELIAEH